MFKTQIREDNMNLLLPFEQIFHDQPLSYLSKRFIDLPILFKWGNVKDRISFLEIGCSTGRFSRFISKKFRFKDYKAVDIDPQAIAKAESKNREKSKVIYQVADVVKLPFENNSFDIVLEMDVLHHVADWKHAIKEIHRVLKPEGRFILRDNSIETFSLPGLGLILRQVLNHPYDFMFDQIELVTYLRKNGFNVTHQNDASWMIMLSATKKK